MVCGAAHVASGRRMTMIRSRKFRNAYFHSHPMHGMFALVASLALAGLIALTVLWTASR